MQPGRDHANRGDARGRKLDEIWRKAMLRVKSVTDRFDVEFPAIPELGIDGTEVALTQEDLVVVSF
jgi:hypothetical protein